MSYGGVLAKVVMFFHRRFIIDNYYSHCPFLKLENYIILLGFVCTLEMSMMLLSQMQYYCVSQKEVKTNLATSFIKIRNFLKLRINTTNEYSIDFQCDKYLVINWWLMKFEAICVWNHFYRFGNAANDFPFYLLAYGLVSTILFAILSKTCW